MDSLLLRFVRKYRFRAKELPTVGKPIGCRECQVCFRGDTSHVRWYSRSTDELSIYTIWNRLRGDQIYYGQKCGCEVAIRQVVQQDVRWLVS